MDKRKTTRRVVLAKTVTYVLLGLAVAVVAFPLPPRGKVAEFTGTGAAAISKQKKRFSFQLTEPLPEITLAMKCRLQSGWITANFISGKSWATFGLRGRQKFESSFSFGRTFQPGSYTIEVEEAPNTRGSWHFIVAKAPPVPWTSRLLWLFIALVAVTGIVALARRRAVDPASRKLVCGFRMLAFGLFLMVLYPVVHELGHTLALVPFGAADFMRADYIGLFGTPHGGATSGYSDLAPWKQSFSSIAGPLFPVLIGFVLTGVWKLRRRSLQNKPMLEAALLWSAFVMLFAQCFALLLPLGILPPDGDYNGYVSGFPGSRTAANALLVAVSLACFLPLSIVLRRLIELGKELKRTSTLAASGSPAGPASIDASLEHGSTGV